MPDKVDTTAILSVQQRQLRFIELQNRLYSFPHEVYLQKQQ